MRLKAGARVRKKKPLPKAKRNKEKTTMTLVTIVNVLVARGHKEEDILWKYSIPKVDRYFDDAIRFMMHERHQLALIIGNALSCHMECATKTQASKQANEWKKFLSALDPLVVKQKARDKKNPLKALATAGVPIFVPQEEDTKESDNK